MRGVVFFILLFVASVFKVDACRFTVREIGFSVLSQDIYTLAIIDAEAFANDKKWLQYHKLNKDCNLRLEVLSPEMDKEHPLVKNANAKGLTFPCTLLVSPEGRVFQFATNNISNIYDEILESNLGQELRTAFPDVFSVVVWVEGKNTEQNLIVEQKVKEECDAIENIMPGMPKLVKQGPRYIAISKENFANEKLLLWSLGLDKIPENPMAFVLYGRGRMIGKGLSFKEIQEGGLYKYMSMIGADCECGLDKKWMLGNQVPLLWNQNSRQNLTKLVGFDVDNPMILAEMSRILAKESLSDATGSVAFAPETINLEEVFGESETLKDERVDVAPMSKSKHVLVYTLIALLVIVFAVGTLVFIKK